MHRTFIAFDLDDASRARLAGLADRLNVAGKIKWVSAENLHVTVKFLGDVRDGDLPGVCGIVGDAAAAAEPFELIVQGLRVFPPRGPERMIWAIGRDASGAGGRLAEVMEARFRSAGYKAERRSWRPHVTVARIGHVSRSAGRTLRLAVAELADERFGAFEVDSVSVYTSKLTSAGAVYSLAARKPLGVMR